MVKLATYNIRKLGKTRSSDVRFFFIILNIVQWAKNYVSRPQVKQWRNIQRFKKNDIEHCVEFKVSNGKSSKMP